MNWLSGPCVLSANGVGASIVHTDAEPYPVIITDADVRADDRERKADDDASAAGGFR